MFCIIYRSTANPTVDQAQIRNLLEQSRNFNLSNDITGCLLCFDHTFVHYLEGDRSVVEDLFGKIRIDRRHTNVVLLYSGHISKREFENWSLAYENFIGPENRSEYLELPVSSYFENDRTHRHPDITTKKFWVSVRTLLGMQTMEKLK